MIGLYFPTWSSPWTSDPTKMDLAGMKKEFPTLDVVYISFASPDNTYVKGSKKWDGTGLSFSMDWNVVVDAIKILKSQGVVVMLSVGGGSYWSSTKLLNAKGSVDLMNDLGLDGIDIDWENGAAKDYELTDAIVKLHPLMNGKYLTFAGFSTGAYGKDGGEYKGMNIDAMVKHGDKIDWINIMSYDAGGPNMYDPLGALDCYRIYYPGPLNIGFLVGQHSWGGYLITRDDVNKWSDYTAKNSDKNGAFLWCYKKPGDPGVKEVIDIASKYFKNVPPGLPTVPQPPTTPKPPSSLSIKCPVCATVFTK
jgi:hypothetical protein